jgi:hypothetical protein
LRWSDAGEGDWDAESMRAFMRRLESMEARGWLRVLAFDGEYRAADAKSRKAALAAYEAELLPDPERADPSIDMDFGLYFEITDDGKAEYVRREGPTEDEAAWKAERANGSLSVWAKTEEIAERVALQTLRGQRQIQQRTAMRCTFELATGELVNGVRVIFRLGPPARSPGRP